jgi:tight adherence protein B
VSPIIAFGVVACAVGCVGSLTGNVADHLLAGRARRRLWPFITAPRLRAPWLPTPLARLLDRRARTRADRDLPLWLDACARSARAGASLRHALIDGAASLAGGPLADELRPFVGALERGVPLGLAVDEQRATGRCSPHRSLVWRALTLASRSGGPAADLLDAVAATLHERAALAREVRALATQARASAVVLVAAPVVFAISAAMADARVLAFFASPLGVGCVLIGLVLDAFGAWWMSRLIGDEP